jgi:hypothetical protein
LNPEINKNDNPVKNKIRFTKIAFALQLVILTFSGVRAQSSFEISIDESAVYESGGNIREVSGNRYVVSILREFEGAQNYTKRYSLLCLLGSQGEVLVMDSLVHGDTAFRNSIFIPYGENGLLCTGSYGTFDGNLSFLKIGTHISYFDLSNNQFDLQWLKKYPFHENGNLGYWTTYPLIKPGTDTCFAGYSFSSTSQYIFGFCTQTGDSLFFKNVPAQTGWALNGLMFSSVDTSMLTHFTKGTYTDFSNIIVRLDKQYDFTSEILYSTGTNLHPTQTKACSHQNGNIYLGGEASWTNWQTGEKFKHFGVFSYSNSFEPLNGIYLTPPDVSSQHAWSETMSIGPNGDIFVASNYDFSGGPFSGNYTYLYLAKLDADLNLIWEKYIGGDRYYSTSTVSATSDGGVIVSGYGYDNDFPETRGFAWICKFDADGIVGTGEYKVHVKAALIYPNPASGYIDIQCNHHNGVVRVFDISGRLLLTEHSKPGIHRIYLNGLNSGIYMIIISANNEQIHKELIIKQ